MRRYIGFVALAAVMAAASVYVSLVETTEAPAGDRGSPTSSVGPAPVPRGQGYDFYVLSLSWSPTFCLSADGADNRQQCGLGKSYGLVVHGLWPQFERGYPEFCSTNHPDRVPESLGQRFLDIMPGMGLIGHQWRKHGSCSGLNQEQYLETTRQAFQRITIPPDFKGAGSEQRLSTETVEELFVRANPGLDRSGMAVSCADGRLKDVRICLTKDLKFRDCHEVDRDACQASVLTVPPAP